MLPRFGGVTLVEVARTMLSANKLPLFFWAEAIATACFTQNRSLVIPRQEKTPYHIINKRKHTIKFFHIFGSLCYIVKDGKNLDKMKEKDRDSTSPAPQCQKMALKHNSLSPDPQSHDNVPIANETLTTSLQELEMLSGLMFNEYFNGATQVVSKSSAVTTVDASNKPPTVTANENINQAENVMVDEDEFINSFGTPVHEEGETASHHVDPSNMHTFYKRHPSEYHWTKDHPLEQVLGKPSQPVRTRRHLEKDNGENIMKSINEGPCHMGTVSDVYCWRNEGAINKPSTCRVLNDLSAEEKGKYKADIVATTIILLQGIPKDIYSLINHYTDAKDIWENVKMILEGSELTKDDRESQLYDEFEHFRQNKGETIQGYYVRFTKRLMTEKHQYGPFPGCILNSKFVKQQVT
ncbi:retrovirus-related pol polyprotein from transposon TNT 1-94 [Tanacetum coccineum]